MIKNTALLFAALLLSSCSLVPGYLRPDITPAPQWRDNAGAADSIDREWWKNFHDAKLEFYITQALAQNNNLAGAIARVEQARAQSRIAASSLWPQASASGDVARDRVHGGGVTTIDNSYRIGASVSYELDLFGRNRAALEAADAREDALRYDRDAIALIVASDVVSSYSELLTLTDRKRVASEQLGNAREILQISEARFREGAADAIEVAQQRTALGNIEASLADLERQRLAAANRLAILTGEQPQNFAIPTGSIDNLQVPAIKPLQPALLLTRRPDIALTEANLIAANADIGAARAAYFPTFSLGADASLLGDPVTKAAGIAASFAAPIFQGGRIAGGVELAEARKAELLTAYRQSILVAFQESEDALAAIQSSAARAESLGTSAEQARIAYRLSRERFDAGQIDFLTLLSTQSSLLQSEDSALRARLDKFQAAVQLYKAMGGGWSEKADSN